MVKMAPVLFAGNRVLPLLNYGWCSFLLLLLVSCSEQSRSLPNLAEDELNKQRYVQFLDQSRRIALAQKALGPSIANAENQRAFLQESAPFEVWVYLAIVADDEGDHYALQQRFVRLRVKQPVATAASEWDFSQVLAVDFQLNHLETQTTQVQSIAQRAALDLAGADELLSRVWVGAYSAQRLDASPLVETETALDSDSVSTLTCDQSIALQAPRLSLNFTQTQCPKSEQTADFTYLSSVSMPVSGEYQVEDKQLHLHGHGWIMHGWGVPPDTKSSAVVFDRAWLLFEGGAELQLQRSRRRSGRGPEKTIGNYRSVNASHRLDKSAELSLLADASFVDDSSDVNKTGVHKNYRFTAPANLIDIKLTPKTPVQVNVQQADRLDVVRIEGSHSGYGFLDLGASNE